MLYRPTAISSRLNPRGNILTEPAMNGDVSIRIGGKAGQGMQAVSGTLGKIFARRGCHVFIHQDFESRIRGGHNFAQVRIRTVPVRAPGDRVNLLVALDRETIDKDLPALGEEGVLVYGLRTPGTYPYPWSGWPARQAVRRS
jgi:Pyruvate/2-oxoacid:ferredoxin oxidoreductase gamma subunit